MASTVVAYGFFGSNHGDVAISKGALHLLEAAGLSVPIKMIGHRLSRESHRRAWMVVSDTHEVELHPWDHRLSCLRSSNGPTIELVDALCAGEMAAQMLEASGVGSASQLVYSGGENLFSYGRVDDDWNLLGRLLPFIIASKRGARLICLPSTFGPFESPFSRKLADLFFSATKATLARDLMSAQYAPEGALGYGLDCAFFIPYPPLAPSHRAVAIVPRLESVGIRLGALATQNADVEASASFALYVAITERLLARNRPVTLFIQCDADVELVTAIHSTVLKKIPTAPVKLVRPRTLDDYLAQLSTCGSMITSRLHSGIFALKLGVLPVFVPWRAHGHKMSGLYDLLGLADFCFNADQADASRIVGAWRNAFERRHEVPTLLNQLESQTIELVRSALLTE